MSTAPVLVPKQPTGVTVAGAANTSWLGWFTVKSAVRWHWLPVLSVTVTL